MTFKINSTYRHSIPYSTFDMYVVNIDSVNANGVELTINYINKITGEAQWLGNRLSDKVTITVDSYDNWIEISDTPIVIGYDKDQWLEI